MMYRLRWYCCAILNGGRFGDLRTIYQGCRALPFGLAGLSCLLSTGGPAEPLDTTGGTLRGTPVEKHWFKLWTNNA